MLVGSATDFIAFTVKTGTCLKKLTKLWFGSIFGPVFGPTDMFLSVYTSDAVNSYHVIQCDSSPPKLTAKDCMSSLTTCQEKSVASSIRSAIYAIILSRFCALFSSNTFYKSLVPIETWITGHMLTLIYWSHQEWLRDARLLSV